MAAPQQDAKQFADKRLAALALGAFGTLGGLILFGDIAKDSFTESSRYLRAAFVTCAVLAGLFLGLSWSAADYALARREFLKNGGQTTGKPNKIPLRFTLYKVATLLVVAAGLILLTAVWWSATVPQVKKPVPASSPLCCTPIQNRCCRPHSQVPTSRPTSPPSTLAPRGK
ncbi:hypothetical protein Scel_29350 [Streptomyces cellostaticus]|nr:hypothetical protein Scel_29350 [Streptomyces cellostaticus]